MNRAKKEEIRKYKEARKGKSPEEIKALDARDRMEKMIGTLARKIHAENFPEEYDRMYDSIQDSKDRASGKNPMNRDYIAKVNARREERGFDNLAENGNSPNDKTYEWALNEAKRRLSTAIIPLQYQWMLSSEKFSKAIDFAVERHADAGKQATVPYVHYLMRVSSLVREFGDNEDEAIAEILHDMVEDSEVTLDEVRCLFGDTVADIFTMSVKKSCREEQNAGWDIDQSWNLGRRMRVLQKDFEESNSNRVTSNSDIASLPSGVKEIKYSTRSGEVICYYEDSDPYDLVIVRNGDYEKRFFTASFSWFMGTLTEEKLLDRFLDGITAHDEQGTTEVVGMVERVILEKCKNYHSGLAPS